MRHRITESFDTFFFELNKGIKNKEMVVFCGAGISLHSGLPIVNELVPYILQKLEVSKKGIDTITNANLPFEAFMETLRDNSDPSEIFGIYNLGEPNTNHFLLAKLAKAGYITTICTTNFDLLIEKAFASENLVKEHDYRVFYKEEDLDGIDWDDNTIRLIKIHGSVEDKDNMAITLGQVASQILSRQRQLVIENIFSKGTHRSVLVLGYSCSDVFDISPQIETIRKNHKRVIFVDHHEDKRTVKDLASKKQKNPFCYFNESNWVLADTDELVKAVWNFCFSEKEYVSPKSVIKKTAWQKCVGLWFLETEEKYTKGNKYSLAGRIFYKISEFKSATENYEQALSIARKIGDKRGEGITLGNLGNACQSLGDHKKAINNYEKALSIARKIDDKRNEGNWLSNLGTAYRSLGDYHKAIENYEQALSIARKIGDKRGEGITLGSLGDTYQHLGNYQKAIENHEQALSIARKIGDKRGEGVRLGNLGNAHDSLGDYQKAIENYEQALSIAKKIGDNRNEGIALGKLGDAYQHLGDYQKAIENYEQALSIARKIGDKRGEESWLGNLGTAYGSLGDHQKAIDNYEQALNIARKIGDKQGEGVRLGNLGIAYQHLGDYQKAIDNLEQALSIARKIGAKRSEGIWLGSLGDAFQRLDDYQKGIDNYEQALSIAREIGDKRNEGIALGSLGIAYRNLGDYQKAIDNYEQALSIAREIGDKRNEGIALGSLGIAYRNLGDYQNAINNYKQALSTLGPMLGDNHPTMKMFRQNLSNTKSLRKQKN